MSKNTTSIFNLRMTVYCALFTALIIIGGYISIPIPIGSVPIVLSDFFVMVTALFLGYRYGLVSTVLYLALGALGFPVFAGGRAGLAVLVGPTGGFLFGYLIMVTTIGLITSKMKPTIVTNLNALVIGNILLFVIGIPWLKFQVSLSWAAALAAGFTPFIIGNCIKIAVASALGQFFLPHFKQTLVSSSIQPVETKTSKCHF